MPFDKNEFKEIQEAIDEAFDYLVLPVKFKRINLDETLMHPLYNEAIRQKETTVTLKATINKKPDIKTLEKFGLSEPIDVIVDIAKCELERQGFVPISTDLMEIDGVTYHITKVMRDTELPITYTKTEEVDDELIEVTVEDKDYLTLVIFGRSDK